MLDFMQAKGWMVRVASDVVSFPKIHLLQQKRMINAVVSPVSRSAYCLCRRPDW